jgi:putative endonuclease
MVSGGSSYIITNQHNTTLYTGSAEDLYARMMEHKEKFYPNAFSARYNLNKLIYYKNFSRIEEAREDERIIKGKSRKWKIDLINSFNPEWKDLTEDLKFRTIKEGYSSPRLLSGL